MKPFTTTLLLSTCLAAGLTAQDDRESTAVGTWLVEPNESTAEISAMRLQGYRPTNIEVRATNPLRFAVTYVRNSGSYFKSSSSFFSGKTAAGVAALITSSKRLIQLRPYVLAGQVRYAGLFIGNTGQDQAQWFYWPSQSFDYIRNRAIMLGARLISIESYELNGTRYYTGLAVKNTGSQTRTWEAFENLTLPQLDAKATGGFEFYDIERRSPGRYDCIVVQPTAPRLSWRYIHKSLAEVEAHAKQNGARIFDLEQYVVNNTAYYLALMIQNTNELTTQVGDDLRRSTDGATGLILRRLAGGTYASLQSDVKFEPGATIAQVHGAYAYSKTQTNPNVSASTQIPFRDGPCPYNTGNLSSEPLSQAVQKSMELNNGRSMDAIEKFFGSKLGIHLFCNSLGMNDTRSIRTPGCGPIPANTMTLDNLVSLHGAIYGGLLGPHADDFFMRMRNSRFVFPGGGNKYLNTVLSEERAKVGLTNGEYAGFISNFEVGYAWGQETTNGRFHVSTSGLVKIPFIVNHAVNPTQFVFGAFADGASNSANAQNGVSNAVHDLLRDRIAAAMVTWKGFEYGSFQKFGSACQVGNKTPIHNGTGSPEIGQIANFELQEGPLSQPAVMWIGLSKTTWAGSPLPVDLGILGAPTCSLYVSPDLVLGANTSQAGTVVRAIPLNVDKGFIGIKIHTQYAALAPGQNAAGFVTSNGLTMTVGGKN